MEGKFVTAINCMDGRTQRPVNQWLRRRFNAQFVDTVTEPGPVRLLAEGLYLTRLDWMKEKLSISVNHHGSGMIALVAHHDCAGNPVDRDRQLAQLAASAIKVKEWFPACEVVKLWVNENWEVEEIE